MPSIDDYLSEAFRSLGPKPDEETANQAEKKRFSEKLSENLAYAFAQELRDRGMKGARPSEPGDLEGSGAERRMEGGIGAKKVDVTWATAEAGLILGVSVKTINWKDKKSANYQKNVTNRRGDLLFEAVTLHRRFPYAVLIGVFCFDVGAAEDATDRRKSTFLNTHDRMKLFTDRPEPSGQEERFEKLYIVLHDPDQFHPSITAYEAGDPETPVPWDDVFHDIVRLVAERTPDTYENVDGRIRKR